MDCFRWISPQRLPPEFDLRARGWCLAADGECERTDYVGLIDARASDARASNAGEPLSSARRRRSLALGVDDSRERAGWLARGFGDALATDTGLDEIAARAGRLLARGWSAARRHGRLALDPLARQATIDGCPLRLFPREFALLWRLSDEPGIPVSRAELLHDVLGLSIEPGTNALAVHICRLRKKLHSARLSHLLITGPGNGSYALLFDDASPRRFGLRNGLDEAGFSGEDVSLLEEAAE